jgi:hypothetical protein
VGPDPRRQPRCVSAFAQSSLCFVLPCGSLTFFCDRGLGHARQRPGAGFRLTEATGAGGSTVTLHNAIRSCLGLFNQAPDSSIGDVWV